MKNTDFDYNQVNGWGVDADPENEPTYPMKKYTGDDHNRLNYERPEQQPAEVEILHSNERPGLPAVFGTPVPPSGISGAIRRYAFKHSETARTDIHTGCRYCLPIALMYGKALSGI